ncbi:MAG: DUF1289 domain-containing protein [Pseudomonadota bacterium]
MTAVSPCTGVCRLDDATGWCLGCARTGEEIAEWRTHSDDWRAAVWEALPTRFPALGIACRRLPWSTNDIHDFIGNSLSDKKGTWVIGVVGAVGEFAATRDACVDLSTNGSEIVANTAGGHLRFFVDDHVRALTFDPPETPLVRQRVVLAVKRQRGRVPVSDTIKDLGPDSAAVDVVDRGFHLYDLGLGRKESRFCVRCGPGMANDALCSEAGSGQSFADAIARLAPILIAESPARVVESTLGRIEVLSPIPLPGGMSPAGPHTHLLPNHIATGRSLPVGWDLPRAYLPGAIFYPAA